MRIHLDLLGGIAGDMFIAAVLDAFPEHEAGLVAAIGAVGGPGAGTCRSLPHRDAVLRGRRFEVEASDGSGSVVEGHEYGGDRDVPHHSHGSENEHEHDPKSHHLRTGHGHDHVAWREIRASLLASTLPQPVIGNAVAIFGRLAEAEAFVHGVDVDAVEFHEVGAWDSIADIVGAAYLIDAVGATRWTVSAVPLGSGRVTTAHGPMPVPAPATACLLKGFETIDDGITGERVTPTGAAVLAYLCEPDVATSVSDRQPRRGRLVRTGTGFGKRLLPGLSNCVRTLVFDDSGAEVAGGHRQLAVIEFEVDDQSAEDLAMGLEHLRAHPAIFDVVQAPVFGKKGRMMTSIRALAALASLDAAVEACFRETTTIGLRHHVVSGSALIRRQHDVALDGATMRVKSVARPGGHTAKTESDDVAAFPGHDARSAMRRRAEALALEPANVAAKVNS